MVSIHRQGLLYLPGFLHAEKYPGVFRQGILSVGTNFHELHKLPVLQRYPYICRRIFRLFAGSLQISKGGLCCPAFFISFFLTFRHAPLSMTERALTPLKGIIA